MAKKRSHNEGSIYKRSNGTWRAQVTLQGKRLSFTGKTRKDCQDWIRKTINQIEDGLTFNSTQITIEQFLSEWLLTIESSIRYKTWEQYNQIVRDYLIPNLGNIKLRELEPNSIQQLYNRKLKEGLGQRTVKTIHAVLHNALNQAVSLSVIVKNPASVTKPPRVKSREMAFYDETQAQQLLITAQNTKDRYFALYKLAITTEMRQGELLGIKWNDLNWNQKSLKVHRQLRRKPGGGFIFAPPKSQAGKRTIILGDSTIGILKEHQEILYQEMLNAGDNWQENDLIFPNTLGTPTQPSKLIKVFKKLIDEAGLPEIRFHDLRHTAASLMLNNNVPVIVVSRRLGHSQPNITLDVYGHLIPAMQYQVAELMDQITTPIEVKITP